jgi:hypothetical protein
VLEGDLGVRRGADGAEASASAPAASAVVDAVSLSSGTDAVWGAAPAAAPRVTAPAGSPTPATRPEETATIIPVRESAVVLSPNAALIVVVVRPVSGVEGGKSARWRARSLTRQTSRTPAR